MRVLKSERRRLPSYPGQDHGRKYLHMIFPSVVSHERYVNMDETILNAQQISLRLQFIAPSVQFFQMVRAGNGFENSF